MAQQFVMGQLKVSVDLGGHPGMELGLCTGSAQVCGYQAGAQPDSTPEIPSPHRASLPIGGISVTSSTMPSPTSSTRTQM